MQRIETVTIIGLGRTARAAAAYLMDKGVHVTMWGRSRDRVNEIREHGMEITGCCMGHYCPETTDDLAQGLEHAQLVLVMTLASGHRDVARQMKGCLRPGQDILIFNGNWGAYEFYQELGNVWKSHQITIGETGSMLFLADYAEGACHVKSNKKEIGAAAVPASETSAMCGRLKQLFPQLVPEENVISTSINSSNPVMHVPVTLFNITRMENGEDYSFYGDAATKRVLGVVEKADRERCDVARAAGVKPKSCLEIINSFWPNKYDTLFEAIKNNQAYVSGKGPRSIKHRYLEEDIPFGIAPIARLGRMFGVATPCIDVLLDAFGVLLDVDAAKDAPCFSAGILQELSKD